jgi:hypothetical protein
VVADRAILFIFFIGLLVLRGGGLCRRHAAYGPWSASHWHERPIGPTALRRRARTSTRRAAGRYRPGGLRRHSQELIQRPAPHSQDLQLLQIPLSLDEQDIQGEYWSNAS